MALVWCGLWVRCEEGTPFPRSLSGCSGLWLSCGCEGLPLPSRSVVPCLDASSLSMSLGLGFPVGCAPWVSRALLDCKDLTGRKEAACLCSFAPGSVPGGGSASRPRRAVCESRPWSWQPWLRARERCAVGRPVLLPKGLRWPLRSPALSCCRKLAA